MTKMSIYTIFTVVKLHFLDVFMAVNQFIAIYFEFLFHFLRIIKNKLYICNARLIYIWLERPTIG